MEKLIQTEEEERLYDTLKSYYSNLYPDVEIKDEELVLSPSEIGELYYTFPGFEEAATFNEKVERIKKAIGHGYNTPIILARKGDKLMILDGHRRAVAAWQLGVKWRALVLVFPQDHKLGIEKLVQGKIEELFSR